MNEESDQKMKKILRGLKSHLSGRRMTPCYRLVSGARVLTPMNRRDALRLTALGSLGLLGWPALGGEIDPPPASLRHFDGQDVFDRIMGRSNAGDWSRLP